MSRFDLRMVPTPTPSTGTSECRTRLMRGMTCCKAWRILFCIFLLSSPKSNAKALLSFITSVIPSSLSCALTPHFAARSNSLSLYHAAEQFEYTMASRCLNSIRSKTGAASSSGPVSAFSPRSNPSWYVRSASSNFPSLNFSFPFWRISSTWRAAFLYIRACFVSVSTRVRALEDLMMTRISAGVAGGILSSSSSSFSSLSLTSLSSPPNFSSVSSVVSPSVSMLLPPLPLCVLVPPSVLLFLASFPLPSIFIFISSLSVFLSSPFDFLPPLDSSAVSSRSFFRLSLKARGNLVV
mmetsp:Transcript_3995/g.5369  ORF Transcript_3995/g.5369 Transcript_3995/m.5369 type:complete len:295 (-) Transcript_3995:365-1249(-)